MALPSCNSCHCCLPPKQMSSVRAGLPPCTTPWPAAIPPSAWRRMHGGGGRPPTARSLLQRRLHQHDGSCAGCTRNVHAQISWRPRSQQLVAPCLIDLRLGTAAAAAAAAAVNRGRPQARPRARPPQALPAGVERDLTPILVCRLESIQMAWPAWGVLSCWARLGIESRVAGGQVAVSSPILKPSHTSTCRPLCPSVWLPSSPPAGCVLGRAPRGLPAPALALHSLSGGRTGCASPPTALQRPGGAGYQALSCRVPSGRSLAPSGPPRSLAIDSRTHLAALQRPHAQGSDLPPPRAAPPPAARRPPAR